MQIVALPDPREVPALFEGLTTPQERLERLVREAFAIYDRGAPELRAIRREPEVHPRVAQSGEEFETSLDALVDSALEPFDVTPADRAVVRAMVDLGTWHALREQSLRGAEAVARVSEMLAAPVTRNSPGRSRRGRSQPTPPRRET